MTNAALRGKPDAGNPHVRFDEGEVASAATPRRGSLLYTLAAICVATASSPSYAARTVEISAYDDATREVSLAFGGISAVAENVYLAYGPADCGGHFHKWPNSVNIGTIATDATSMTYVLPAAITTGTYYRFFVGDCPYDAELE